MVCLQLFMIIQPSGLRDRFSGLSMQEIESPFGVFECVQDKASLHLMPPSRPLTVALPFLCSKHRFSVNSGRLSVSQGQGPCLSYAWPHMMNNSS